MLKIIIEKSEESLDFGGLPTVRIMAFTPQAAFRLGVMFMELVAADVKVVAGDTADGQGRLLRLPLTYLQKGQ